MGGGFPGKQKDLRDIKTRKKGGNCIWVNKKNSEGVIKTKIWGEGFRVNKKI